MYRENVPSLEFLPAGCLRPRYTRRAMTPGSGGEQACNKTLNWSPGSGLAVQI